MTEQEKQRSDLVTGLRAAYEAGKAAALFAAQEPSSGRVEHPGRPPRDDGWHH